MHEQASFLTFGRVFPIHLLEKKKLVGGSEIGRYNFDNRETIYIDKYTDHEHFNAAI